MELRKVPGTKVRGGIYYLNLRIPQAAQSEYDGETHLRRSLKTSDHREAERQVTLARAELIEAARRAHQRANVGDAVAELPPEQRRLYEEAGGLEGLLKEYRGWQTALAFMKAGTPADAWDIDVDGGEFDYVRKTGTPPVKVVTRHSKESLSRKINFSHVTP